MNSTEPQNKAKLTKFCERRLQKIIVKFKWKNKEARTYREILKKKSNKGDHLYSIQKQILKVK